MCSSDLGPRLLGAEDYVLRLTDSIEPEAIARAVDEYVVTPRWPRRSTPPSGWSPRR